MDEQSVKVAEVAKLPLKLDLQLFSEDEPSGEGGFSFDNPNSEPSVTVDEGTQAQEEVSTTETVEEVAEPPADKQPQDAETNAKFADMRRKMEAMEKQVKFAEKYGQYGVTNESDISKKYGHMGIHTLDQLDQAITNQQREQERQKWIDEGYDPDRIEALVDDKLNNHPSVVAAREVEYNNMLQQNYNDVVSEYPDLVKSPDDISEEVWQKWNNGKSGISLADAYTLINRKEIAAKQQAAVKQAALNNLNSKNHLRPNGSDGSGSPDMGQIPDDVMDGYRRMFSKELKSGKMKEADFIKHYKKSLKS